MIDRFRGCTSTIHPTQSWFKRDHQNVHMFWVFDLRINLHFAVLWENSPRSTNLLVALDEKYINIMILWIPMFNNIRKISWDVPQDPLVSFCISCFLSGTVFMLETWNAANHEALSRNLETVGFLGPNQWAKNIPKRSRRIAIVVQFSRVYSFSNSLSVSQHIKLGNL